MIFKEILKRDGLALRDEFQKLLNLATKTQFHPGDLLLLNENGFYNPEILDFRGADGGKLNPHVIGPGAEGYAEQTHYEYIHHYRTTNYSDKPLDEYTKLFDLKEFDQMRYDANNLLIQKEALSIHAEMLVYLKIWESDFFIRKMYQLVRLLNGEHYDWYFKIQETARDTEFTGSRQEIIRKLIRDRIKKISPLLFDTISRCYKTQIRNSIAHSNFSIMGRNIQLNNFIKDDPASQLHTISFDEWINIFHGTLLLWSEYVGIYTDLNNYYLEIAAGNGNIIPILVTEKDKTQYEQPVQFRRESKSWGYQQRK